MMKETYFNTHNKSTNVRVVSFQQRLTHALLGFSWRWWPSLTRWFVLRLFFAPSAYRINSVEAACLKQGYPFQIRVNGKTIRGWKWGTGPAVLLVHGWNGRGIQFHGFVAPLIRSGYTAIAIDGPAHGASTGHVTSYFEFTDTIRSLLSENRNLGIIGIIAHSFGAAAVINAVEKEGLMVNMVWIAPVLQLRALLFNTFDQFGVPRSVYTSLINEFETRFGYSLQTDNPCRLLSGLSGSALIIHDEKDRTVQLRDSEEQAIKNGNISLYATCGLGHRRILTDKTVIGRCLTHLAKSNIRVA